MLITNGCGVFAVVKRGAVCDFLMWRSNSLIAAIRSPYFLKRERLLVSLQAKV
ncbi:hypothetical protein IQ269_25010 [Tychonema sp. LEGE 07199]|uniref:hypothetical protein n=1 Tax=unclassified Tychonema TaxID=2642144 RepID=UPI00187DE71C|nr:MULTISPECIES: hypothetical protein [unclassified Tychonema]MBE9123969.1 hypothetical protein [Tychonema sp. LEGE 07199]MBE9135423.1 hypothetical protein [Tychonema sp. LEGE 07196]